MRAGFQEVKDFFKPHKSPVHRAPLCLLVVEKAPDTSHADLWLRRFAILAQRLCVRLSEKLNSLSQPCLLFHLYVYGPLHDLFQMDISI